MDLSYVSYYHGSLSREEAENILTGKVVGSYLLRKSLNSNDKYALSVTASDKIIHYSIEKSPQTHLYSVSHGSEHQNPVLVCEHYVAENAGLKIKLRYPVPCEKELSSVGSQTEQVSINSNVGSSNYEEHDWFHGKITRQQDTRRLSNAYYLTKQNGIFLVRSKDEGKFVLSLVHSEKVHRYIISCDPITHEYFLDEKQKNLRFNSIEDLLDFHKKYPPEVTGLQCQLTVPCCRSSVAVNEKEVSRFTSNSSSNGFMSSVKSLASALATELKSMLPKNSLDVTWSDTSGQSKYESEERAVFVMPKNNPFTRFDRKSMPKDSIGFYSLYRNCSQKASRSRSVAPDLFISMDEIKLLDDLGKGHFGSVQLAECNLMGENVPCAVKILSGSDVQMNKEDLLKEAALMQGLDHPYIVRLLAVCQPSDDGNLMIVLELAPLGTLKNFIRGYDSRSFPEHRILVLMNQVCDGMAYLAHNNIVHRDLAARNLLLVSENFVKISDFGMSRILHDSENYYRASKPGSWPLRWYPPEALLYYKFTSKGDVWSFGITVWEVSSYGCRPYKGMKGKEILQMIENEKRLDCPAGCSPGVYSLLLQCWAFEPTKRPSFQKILEILDQLLKI